MCVCVCCHKPTHRFTDIFSASVSGFVGGILLLSHFGETLRNVAAVKVVPSSSQIKWEKKATQTPTEVAAFSDLFWVLVWHFFLSFPPRESLFLFPNHPEITNPRKILFFKKRKRRREEWQNKSERVPSSCFAN